MIDEYEFFSLRVFRSEIIAPNQINFCKSNVCFFWAIIWRPSCQCCHNDCFVVHDDHVLCWGWQQNGVEWF